MRNKVLITNVDYFMHPLTEQPVVRIFGRTDKGEAITLYDDRTYPYFYLANPRKYDERLLQRAGANVVEYKRLKDSSNVINCAKVRVRTPRDVIKLRERLHKRRRITYSSDILHQLRYMYDMDIGSYVNVMYDENNKVRTIRNVDPFKVDLQVMCFDIESSIRTKDIYCIAVRVNDDKEIFDDSNGEKEMLEKFVEYVRLKDPDIITGYNIFGFDIPYVNNACKRHNVDFCIGRDGSEPWKRDDQKYRIAKWNLTGRILVDTWMEVRNELKPIQENLEFVGQLLELGGKSDIDASRIEEEWRNRPDEVMEYCMRDVDLTYDVFNHPKIAYLYKAKALCLATKLPLDNCFAPKTTQMVDSILIRRFDKEGYVVPQNRWGETAEKIKGATVFNVFKPGIYEDIAILDFKSMYPSIMIRNNICPTTFCREEPKEEHVTSPIGAHFRTDKKGIVPDVLKTLWAWRDETKLNIKNSGDYSDRLQNSIKVLMNSFYGVMASSFYRFTDADIGGSVTAYARQGIRNVQRNLKDSGQQVIYGDTDSVFVQVHGTNPFDLAKILSKDGMEMEVEKILATFFTHGAKKRYAANIKWPKEEFYVMGYELKRGDSFETQRRALKGALVRILDNEPDKAFKFVSNIVKDIKEGRIPLNELVITKSVKDASSYVNPKSMAGVQASQKLVARGYAWIPNSKVSWIVTDCKCTPMEVEPYVEDFCDDMKPDWTYYAQRIVRTLSDIAAVFEWDDIGLSSGTKQEKLF